MVRLPGEKPVRVKEYVGNAAIFSMILRLVGISDPRPSDKVYEADLLSTARRSESAEGHTYTLCESTGIELRWIPGSHEPKTVVRSDGFNLVYDTRTREYRLFNLKKDPGEDHDISDAEERKGILSELKRELAARTDLKCDYPAVRGEYVGHAVPLQRIRKLFGPPLDVVRKFGTPEELTKYEKGNSK